jgi:hypothetical protein
VKRCAHPKKSRELLHGYDVLCGACGEAIGRVALFPCAVLELDEAKAVLENREGDALRRARGKLEHAVQWERSSA